MSMIEKISVNEQSSIRMDAGKIIYVDPYNIANESHDGNVIFFTHAHPDHFSPADYQKVAKADTVFVAPESMADIVLDAGIEKEKLITLRPGNSCTILDMAVEAVPAYNIGKPMHPKVKGWLGYVITAENSRIYVCGDTDATPEGKKVNCDIVLVPIGGFFTMGVKAAVAFVNELKPKVAVPTHYGSVVGKPEDAYEFKKLINAETQVHILIPEK